MNGTTWIDSPTRYLFFTGKGGVGKTSLACATAVRLAGAGERVLLVSTDPASNLGQVFGQTIGERDATPIAGVPGLLARNIDPEAAARAYRERLVGPVRGVLPDASVRSIEEQLSGACTTEIAAFDEFTALLTGGEETTAFDHIVFDTAPTGHTLRLLSLPGAWSDYLDSGTGDASCLGPLAGLEKQRARYAEAVRVLADRARTLVLLVSRPQPGSLAEAARTSVELAALGVSNQRLILNGLMPDTPSGDPMAVAIVEREKRAVEGMPEALAGLPLDRVPLRAWNMVGVDALRRLLEPGAVPTSAPPDESVDDPGVPSLGSLIDEIEAEGHGLVLVMGKGGVGKTTVAAAVAVELAARGHDVHLTTTDPAAHVELTVEAGIERLEVSRIDPRVETERYRQHVLETRGKDLDAAGKALLEEDLRSPCTEEIAVFQAFSKAIREARRRFVVVDTAPTGHTLLLLDATGAYHRDVVRLSHEGRGMVTPLMRLQDPRYTRLLIVTLPETTPVLEAAALQEDLRRTKIEPWAWVLNACLSAGNVTDPLLAARARLERPQIATVRSRLASRACLVPYLAEEPVGRERLLRLTRVLTTPASPRPA